MAGKGAKKGKKGTALSFKVEEIDVFYKWKQVKVTSSGSLGEARL